MSAILKRFFSGIWSTASMLARALARAGLLKRERLPGVRVVSVGNIQAGGAGKTPLVARIAREAHERGLSAAILCRGYGSAWEASGGRILPGDPAPETGLCGDEAALLHELAPDAVIGVGADRAKRFREISAEKKFDLVILDDGFQHWKLERDLDIIAVTSANRNEFFFRDWGSALRAADLLVWTKGESPEPKTYGKPLTRVKFRIPRAQNAEEVILVTGVGDSGEVRRSVEAAGYLLAEHVVFPDHARYDSGQVLSMLRKARQLGRKIAVTGKDWVKWREAGVQREDVIVFEPELVFESGREYWEALLWK